MGRRIVNGKDMGSTGEGNGDHVINTHGGNYTAHLGGDYMQGNFVQGDYVKGSAVNFDSWAQQTSRQDYSGDDAIDVEAAEVNDSLFKNWFQ